MGKGVIFDPVKVEVDPDNEESLIFNLTGYDYLNEDNPYPDGDGLGVIYL